MRLLNVLVVEDEPSLLLSITHAIKHLGHRVVSAANGHDALQKLQQQPIDVIISDWVMPQMDGLALCREVKKRQTPDDDYIYFILLTGQADRDGLMLGLNAGVDDFMAKPVMVEELRVRLKAGSQVKSLKESLASHSRHLEEVQEKSELDVKEAKAIEKSLIPEAQTIHGVHFDWMLQQSNNPGGDMMGFAPTEEGLIEFYHIHVAGRVMSSMILAMNLRNILSSQTWESTDPQMIPESRLKELNQRFCHKGEGGVYFSMVYGVIDTQEETLQLAKAGHHPTLIFSSEKQHLSSIGQESLPLGLTPNIPIEVFQGRFTQGDRLIIGSEGITNVLNHRDEEYGFRRFYQLADKLQGDELASLPISVLGSLVKWRNIAQFDDDVSVIAIENQQNQSSIQDVA